MTGIVCLCEKEKSTHEVPLLETLSARWGLILLTCLGKQLKRYSTAKAIGQDNQITAISCATTGRHQAAISSSRNIKGGSLLVRTTTGIEGLNRRTRYFSATQEGSRLER